MSTTHAPPPVAPAPTPSRGRRAAPRRASRRAPSREFAPPALERRRRRVLGLGVGQLVACEIALTAVGTAFLVSPAAAGVAALPAVGVLVLALGRRRRKFLYEWVRLRLAYRRRRRSIRRRPAEDPRIGLLRELSPTLEVLEVTNRSGIRLGAVGDGQAWCALLEVLPEREGGGIVEPGSGPRIPYRLLADSLELRGIRLASIQVLTHTVPVNGGGDMPFVRSYQQLANAGVPPRRATWIVLRLDPALCPDEVALRGGGDDGARRALLTTASRLAVGLRAGGVPVRLLDAHDALAALVTCTGANPWQQGGTGRRTAERWTSWVCDGVENVTFWVRRWPAPARSSPRDLFARVASANNLTSTLSVVLTGRDDGLVGFHSLVRVSGGRPGVAAKQLTASMEKLASALGADLECLDGQHGLGVLATLPVGGGAR